MTSRFASALASSVASACALALVACSSSSQSPASPDASTPATSSDGGSTADAADGGYPNFVYDAAPGVDFQQAPVPTIDDAGVDLPGTCPAQAPAIGDACTAAGATCSYGDSIEPQCRTWRGCAGGHWFDAASGDLTNCTAFDPVCQGTTPADLPVCPVGGGLACHYASGTLCDCYDIWHCTAPTHATGCPATAPNVGTACTGDAKCQYGGIGSDCAGGLVVGCFGGVWDGYLCSMPIP